MPDTHIPAQNVQSQSQSSSPPLQLAGSQFPSHWENQLKTVQIVVYSMVVVLVILAVTLVLQYFSTTQATFEDLKDQILQQNAKIDFLAEEMRSRGAIPNMPEVKTK
jgi:hypothetical protein